MVPFAGIIVSIIYKLANLDRWHGPAESILAARVSPKEDPNTEAGLLSTLASAVSFGRGCISRTIWTIGSFWWSYWRLYIKAH